MLHECELRVARRTAWQSHRGLYVPAVHSAAGAGRPAPARQQHRPGMHGTGPAWHWPGMALARSVCREIAALPCEWETHMRRVTGSSAAHLRATLRRDEPTDARLLRERRHLRPQQPTRTAGLGSQAGPARADAQHGPVPPCGHRAGTKEQPRALFGPLPPRLHPPSPLPYVLYPPLARPRTPARHRLAPHSRAMA